VLEFVVKWINTVI